MRSQVLARLVHSANPNNKPKKSSPATAATATAGRMKRALCQRARVLVAPGGPRAAGAVRRGLGGAGAGITLAGGISLIGLPVGLFARSLPFI